MTNLNWIIIGIVIVVLIVVIYFMNKKFQLETLSLANNQQQNQQQIQPVNNLGLIGGIISGVLNSSSVTALLNNASSKKT